MNGWLPIETAPRDGTKVLVWPHAIAFFDERINERHWLMASPYLVGSVRAVIPAPTHWQPLPAPPSEGEAQAGE